MEKLKIYNKDDEKIIFEIPYSIYASDNLLRKIFNLIKIRANIDEQVDWEIIENLSNEIKKSAWENNKEWIMKKIQN